MKTFTKIKCIIPFTDFIISRQGYCYSCCPFWTTIKPLGKLTVDNSIMDLWNGKNIQLIRQAVLDDNPARTCNLKFCPHAIRNRDIDLINFKTEDKNLQAIIDQIKMGKTILETPPYSIELSYSSSCNLKCIMCFSHDDYFNVDTEFEKLIYSKKIPEVLHGVSKLQMTGGEPLFNKGIREFLQNLDSARYPLLKISFITNGLLFTPKFWDTVKHNNFHGISVSIDAASKTTYEYIRKNGNWDILKRNLDFIAALRRESSFEYFIMTFTVMKSNYKEMKDFVRLGNELSCDLSYFQKIGGVGDTRENINFSNNKRIMIEIAGILKDPIFFNNNVDITVLEDYKKYFGKTSSIFNEIASIVKGNLFYHPTHIVLKSFKRFPKFFDIVQSLMNNKSKF